MHFMFFIDHGCSAVPVQDIVGLSG